MTKAKATIEVENIDYKEKYHEAQDKIIKLESKLSVSDLLSDIRERLIRIEDKVKIHNSYEERIQANEKKINKHEVYFGIMIGIYATVEFLTKTFFK